MKFRLGTAGIVLGFLVFAAGHALANAPPPPGYREPPKPVKQEVKVPVVMKTADLSAEGIQAKIVIPLSMKPGEVAPAAAPKAVPAPPLNASPPRSGALITPAQRSVFAATALSLAALSIVFVVRGKKLKTSHKAAVVGVTCMLGIFGAAQADIRVPGQPFTPNGPVRPRPAVAARDQILIEYSADATEVTLTVHGK
ncbi:hypothetical protein NA78x_004042 [Anatilimnocola sp. NA78]|uniref:hypothetical protein n=1 Tax=Anatilimnocola sp. NA78 TaxID=3415683 RepID=UPI003CE464BC